MGCRLWKAAGLLLVAGARGPAGDDAPLPTVTVDAAETDASEDGTAGRFVIRVSGRLALGRTVGFSLSGTAASGLDYRALPGFASPARSDAAELTVLAADDAEREGEETVVLTLLPGDGYRVGRPSDATVRIRDNDAP
jgi:hypothetical protein